VRGELWTVAGGVYASKPRPSLVIQDDYFATIGSVTVLPLTSTPTDYPLLRVKIIATPHHGLTQDSWIMIDKMTTVRRSHLGQRIGRITASELVTVERRMTVFLGLAR
jgi:mRNA interferase MazF